MKTAILLSTYNGEKYLSQQLTSILGQTCGQFQLYCRDDHSSDATVEILQKMEQQDERVVLVPSDKNLGAAESFMTLLASVDADYYLFADQDDVWMPHKIQTLLAKIQQEEKTAPLPLPLLIFSDLQVVDSSLREIAPSFWSFNKLPPQLLTQNLDFVNVFNAAPGCSMIFNRALRDKALEIRPDNILMHDWYLMLVAARHGRFVPHHEPLVQYRQHEANVLGAQQQKAGEKWLGALGRLRRIYHGQRDVYRFVKSVTGISYHHYISLKLKFNILRFRT